MKEIIEKLKSMIHSLEKKHGPLLVFALFLREAALDKWDIIVSASWLNSNEIDSYNIISQSLQETLSDFELVRISRIVILDQNEPVVNYLQDIKTISNGGFDECSREELSDKFKIAIKRAYLLRSQK